MSHHAPLNDHLSLNTIIIQDSRALLDPLPFTKYPIVAISCKGSSYQGFSWTEIYFGHFVYAAPI